MGGEKVSEKKEDLGDWCDQGRYLLGGFCDVRSWPFSMQNLRANLRGNYRRPRHRLLVLVFDMAIRAGTNRSQTNRTSTATTTPRTRHDDVLHGVCDVLQKAFPKVVFFAEFLKRRPESPLNRSITCPLASSPPLLAWFGVVRHIDPRLRHQVVSIEKLNPRSAIRAQQDALSLLLLDSRSQPLVPTPRARPHPPLQIPFLFVPSLPLCSQIYAGCPAASTSCKKIACAM